MHALFATNKGRMGICTFDRSREIHGISWILFSASLKKFNILQCILRECGFEPSFF